MNKDSLIGATLAGKYEIIEKTGSGGMGVIYKANQLSLNRIVAIKMLSSELSSDSNFVERFKREAKAAARVTHDNIVRIYDVDAIEDVYFIVMEFVEGETLENLMKEKGRLPLIDVLSIIEQVCSALQVAHKHGIVHRDIKPQNIMVLGETGRVKVMDFGIARVEDSTFKTQTGSTVGTPAYMSPEQAKGEAIDWKSDVYSLGVVLYQMLTGSLPFDGTTIAIAMKHVNEEPPLPSSLAPDIPPAVESVIMKAMAKNPDKRFADAGEMADTLRKAVQGESTASGKSVLFAPTMVSDTPAKIKAVKSRKKAQTIAAISLAAIVVAAGVIYGVRSIIKKPVEVSSPVRETPTPAVEIPIQPEIKTPPAEPALTERPAPEPAAADKPAPAAKPVPEPAVAVVEKPEEPPAQPPQEPAVNKEVEELIQSAEKLFSEGAYGEARKNYAKALKIDPDNTAARRRFKEIDAVKERMLRTAMGSLKNREFPAAKKAAEDVLEIDNEDTKAVELLASLRRDKDMNISEGKKAFDEGDYTKARTAFETTRAIDPESKEASRYLEEINKKKEEWLKSGISAFEDKRYRDALAEFKKVIAIDDQESRALNYREKVKKILADIVSEGQQEFKSEHYAAAAEKFRSALKVEENSEVKGFLEAIAEKEKGLYSKAEALLQEGKYEEAEELFRKFGENTTRKELLQTIGEIKKVLKRVSLFDAAVDKEDLKGYCAMIDSDDPELVASEEKNIKNLFSRFNAIKSERSGVKVSVKDDRAVVTGLWSLSAEHGGSTDKIQFYEGEFTMELVRKDNEWKITKSGFQ